MNQAFRKLLWYVLKPQKGKQYSFTKTYQTFQRLLHTLLAREAIVTCLSGVCTASKWEEVVMIFFISRRDYWQIVNSGVWPGWSHSGVCHENVGFAGKWLHPLSGRCVGISLIFVMITCQFITFVQAVPSCCRFLLYSRTVTSAPACI